MCVNSLDYKLEKLLFKKDIKKEYYLLFPSTKDYLQILEIIHEIQCLQREKNRFKENFF
jgi:hypothetical protein